MAKTLRLTPARAALLRDVQQGIIVGDSAGDIWRDEHLAAFYDPFTATRERVTKRVRQLRDAGWIEAGMHRSYRLTDAGREQLATVSAPNPSQLSDQAGGA